MRQDCTEWLSGSSCGNVELIDNAQIKDINQNLSKYIKIHKIIKKKKKTIKIN